MSRHRGRAIRVVFRHGPTTRALHQAVAQSTIPVMSWWVGLDRVAFSDALPREAGRMVGTLSAQAGSGPSPYIDQRQGFDLSRKQGPPR